MKTIGLSCCLLIFYFALSFGLIPVRGQKPIKDLEPTVILVSLDGFRYDYLEKYRPPTLNRLARRGIRAKWLVPSFPTKTFPNHYTIATGLYPENNGIIENNIRDFGTTFAISKSEEVQKSRWWLGEPIWITAEKQGLRAGTYFFPGTEAEIMGRRPTFWKPYDGKVPNEQRVDTVLGWLDLPPVQRPRFITLYFSDVDDAGHAYSPDSPRTREAVLRADAAVKRLVNGLKQRRIDKKVNLIIVSDHGMAAVDTRKKIILDDYFDSALAEQIIRTGEIVQIFPKPGREGEIITGLAGIRNAVCWRKNEIPARLHYQASPRIAPIVCSSDVGWVMTERSKMQQVSSPTIRGGHGYDNSAEAMRAIFIARGEAFARHKVAEPFSNVEIYNVMCRILGLLPAPNDGNFANVKALLR